MGQKWKKIVVQLCITYKAKAKIKVFCLGGGGGDLHSGAEQRHYKYFSMKMHWF